MDPRVMMGERTSLFETTWIRNTSAIDRLDDQELGSVPPNNAIKILEICPIKS